MLDKPQFDKDGFLVGYDSWRPELAEKIAADLHIELTEQHWEIIRLVRRYYEEYDSAPAMRALTNLCRIHLGESQGNSIYLLKLFPGSPAKLACKVSGLPKPDFCI